VAVDVRDCGAKGEDRRSWWVAAAIAFVLLVAFAGAPASAWATDNTINFSSPTVSPGNTLTTQYASQGVTFGQSPLGPSQAQPLDVESSSLAPAPANVARQLCVVEICTLSQWIELNPEVNHVSMSVAAAGIASASVTLTAYDSSGNQITGSGGSATQTVKNSGLTSLSVSAAAAATTIAFVQVTANDGSQGEGFEFTNLSYGPVTTTPMPDFGLVNPGSTGGVVVNAGGPSASATLTLRRYGGSTGAIVLSHSSPPAGVTLDIAPIFDSDPDGSAVTLTFTAAAGAAAVTEAPVTITGTPSSTAGTTSHSITVPVTVVTPQTTYGLRIQGLELTQGIQTFTLPTPAAPSRTVPYSGVKLVAGMPAVVRVFADAPNATAPISNVGAQLVGTDSAGRPLPGSPLVPVSDELPLSDSGQSTVPLSERYSSLGGYDFALPVSWLENGTAAQPITLTATLTPPPESLTNPSDEVPCSDPTCVALRTFTLTDVNALNVGQTQIASVMLSNNGVTPSFTPSWFAWAKRLMPAGLDIFPPFGTVDITWETQGCPFHSFYQSGKACASRNAALGAVLSGLEDFAKNSLGARNAGHNAGPVIGVVNQGAGGSSGFFGVENSKSLQQNFPVAVVDPGRPLTDVAHEIGHMFGLAHASVACGGGTGGQTGQPWPPDQLGYIDGIGLDIAAPNAGLLNSYPVVDGPPPPGLSGLSSGNPSQYMDFMSYCAGTGGENANGTLGGSDAWISVRNWDYIATEASCLYQQLEGTVSRSFDCGSAARGAQGADANAAASQQANAASVGANTQSAERDGAGMTSVYGYLAPEGARIAVVDPTPSNDPLTGSSSPMSLELEGAHGRLLAREPLLVTDTHVDPDSKSPGGPLVLFEGALPQRAAASAIAVVSDGQVLTIDRKPAHEPRLKLLAPRAKLRVKGTGRVVVRWRATNPDRVHLTVSVDFSTNNGHTWRTVYMGENTGHISLPSAYFTHSKSARVRVRVNDGFDQVSATSGRFTILKPKPKAKHRH
jgi:hypothetical protein